MTVSELMRRLRCENPDATVVVPSARGWDDCTRLTVERDYTSGEEIIRLDHDFVEHEWEARSRLDREGHEDDVRCAECGLGHPTHMHSGLGEKAAANLDD